jgi:hypothetical protein
MVVRDIYRRDEVHDLRRAIEGLFDRYSTWATTGLYVFWDPETREVLYIGEDSKMSRRFGSHNGIPKGPPASDKREEVATWFSEHEWLGYSVIAQSAAVGETAKEVIDHGEGQLIETYRQINGGLPPWNRIGGGTAGRKNARVRPSLLDLATGPRDSLLVARLTIRQLAVSPEAQRHEETLHTARLHASFEAAISSDPSINDDDIRRWLMRLVSTPERYGIEMADHIALASSGYLLLDAPFS